MCTQAPVLAFLLRGQSWQTSTAATGRANNHSRGIMPLSSARIWPAASAALVAFILILPVTSHGDASRAYSFELSRVAHRIDTGMFFGTQHWPKTNEDKALFLPRLHRYGIRLIRQELYFEKLIPESSCPDTKTFWKHIIDPAFVDSWNWSEDDWLAEAKKEGFRTMAVFFRMPQFVTANGTLPRKGDEAAWKAWGAVCAEAYKRLGENIDYLEIFNEAQFFTKADNTGYQRTVEADPDIFHYAQERLRPLTRKPIGGPTTWIDCWAGSALETMPFDSRSKRDTLDYFTIHVYDAPARDFLDRIDHTRAVLDGTAPNLPKNYKAPWKGKPIWVTEWNQYWEVKKRQGADWYGFILTEFLARGIPNVIYNYNEEFDPKRANENTPWLLLVQCGLNSAAQTVMIHPRTDRGGVQTTGNSIVATLPDRSIVVIATNLTDDPLPATWRLDGVRGLNVKRTRLRIWDARAGSDDLTLIGKEGTPALTVRPTGCDIAYTLPAHSISSLKIMR